jgi:hypothetical protein
MKTCSHCLQRKPLDDYYAADGNSDGKMGKCKKCHRTRQQTLRKRYGDRLMVQSEHAPRTRPSIGETK